MTVEESIQDAERQVQAAQRRRDALLALQHAGLMFDPAGVDYVTLWIADASAVGEHVSPVRAVRTTPDGGWAWLSGGTQQGHWSDLIQWATVDTCYVVAVTRSTQVETINLTAEVFDPRTPS